MGKQTLTKIKSWFQTGDKPTQAQFFDTFDSFIHKDETINVAKIIGWAVDNATIEIDPVTNKLKVMDDAISKLKLKDDAVETSKVKDGAITRAKLDPSIPLSGLTADQTNKLSNLGTNAARVLTNYEAYVQGLPGVTTDANYPVGLTDQVNAIKSGLYAIVNFVNKVFVKKETGKGLSENDFTDGYKNKVDNFLSSYPKYVKGSINSNVQATNKDWFFVNVDDDLTIKTPRPAVSGDSFIISIANMDAGKKISVDYEGAATRNITTDGTDYYILYDGTNWNFNDIEKPAGSGGGGGAASVDVDDVTINKNALSQIQIKPLGVDTAQVKDKAITAAKLADGVAVSGPRGAKGDKGDPGTAGATGAQGPRGLQGPQGDRGATGARGPAGAQGPAGADGAAGVKGDTGAQGPRGLTGATGARGAQGPQGVKGDKGDKGNKGDKGDKGNPGVDGAVKVDGITLEKAADNTVSVREIDTGEIKDNAVTTSKIKNANVTDAKLATDSVTTNKIKNLNVTTSKLVNKAVTTTKIANATNNDDVLLTTKGTKNPKWGKVGTVNISNKAITAAKLDDNAVKVDDVTIEKDTTDSDKLKVKNSGIDTLQLKDGSVTQVKLNDDVLQNTAIVHEVRRTIGSSSTLNLPFSLDSTFKFTLAAGDSYTSPEITGDFEGPFFDGVEYFGTVTQKTGNWGSSIYFRRASATSIKLVIGAITGNRHLKFSIPDNRFFDLINFNINSVSKKVELNDSGVSISKLGSNVQGALFAQGIQTAVIASGGTVTFPTYGIDLDQVKTLVINIGDGRVGGFDILTSVLVQDLKDNNKKYTATNLFRNTAWTTSGRIEVERITKKQIKIYNYSRGLTQITGDKLHAIIPHMRTTTALIKDANVTEAKLATDAVVTSKIKDKNVTTGKIADDAITPAKLEHPAGLNDVLLTQAGTKIPAWGKVGISNLATELRGKLDSPITVEAFEGKLVTDIFTLETINFDWNNTITLSIGESSAAGGTIHMITLVNNATTDGDHLAVNTYTGTWGDRRVYLHRRSNRTFSVKVSRMGGTRTFYLTSAPRVYTESIVDGNITTDKIAFNAVTVAEIEHSINNDEVLLTQTGTKTPAWGKIEGVNFKDDSITEDKLAPAIRSKLNNSKTVKSINYAVSGKLALEFGSTYKVFTFEDIETNLKVTPLNRIFIEFQVRYIHTGKTLKIYDKDKTTLLYTLDSSHSNGMYTLWWDGATSKFILSEMYRYDKAFLKTYYFV